MNKNKGDDYFHDWIKEWNAILKSKKLLEENDNCIIACIHKVERIVNKYAFWILVLLIFNSFLLLKLLFK